MCTQKKSIKLHLIVMMIRDCKHSIELQHPYGTNAFKVCESEILRKIHCNVLMINFDDYVNENKTEHNKSGPYTPDHPYRILTIGVSGSGKTNVLLNLIENRPDIDQIHLYAKDPYEAKYQYLIIETEGVCINCSNDTKAFIEYSSDMYVYKNINYYNPVRENKTLIVLDDMIADMIQNKKLNSIRTELFIRGRKLNISLVFNTQSYFKVPKDIRLNTTYIFLQKF